MSPSTEIAFYAIAALLFFLASLFSREDEWVSSVGSTGCLLVFWAINNAMWMLASIRSWSLSTDTLFTTAAFMVFLVTRSRWALLLSILYAIDVAVDHAYMIGRIGYVIWAEIENAAFIAQLAAASYPGWSAMLGVRRPPPLAQTPAAVALDPSF